MSNAEIADQLAVLAQLLAANKESTYKIKAYQRAAAKIRTLSESVEELVRENSDLTVYSGIGQAISYAIREIVHTGKLEKLERLGSQVPPEIAALRKYPRLDPKRILRAYKRLGISSVDELIAKLDNGELMRALGPRLAQHIRQGVTETHAILLYKAHELRAAVEAFLLGAGKVRAAEAVGSYRRRVETMEELSFLVETDDFPALIGRLERYGGRTPLLASTRTSATFAMSSGIRLRVDQATKENWGLSLIKCTGSEAHLHKLSDFIGTWDFVQNAGPFASEQAFYARFHLSFIPPELREGHDEIERAEHGTLPKLVTVDDIRGELHAHSTSSDGSDSIERMAIAARDIGYQYIGITDHSQSLKIARGVTVDDLWKQVRYIDALNSRLGGIRVLKSAEVDILADGTLDYADELLKELDYTVCSVHSRFGLTKQEQTERILRAMDNRYFNILGHPTGRLLLKRPGYELDIYRIIHHAKQSGCFFEINSSPDRLDLSAENARVANEAGVKTAVLTDAHSTREFGTIRQGIDQARRAGLEPASILNCSPWPSLQQLFRR
ncbi:MAG TPA: PHP domain-containing protein [Bryobacteraceae bacterium]